MVGEINSADIISKYNDRQKKSLDYVSQSNNSNLSGLGNKYEGLTQLLSKNNMYHAENQYPKQLNKTHSSKKTP